MNPFMMPPDVDAVFTRFPEPVQRRLREIRYMIFELASSTDTVGPISETLKWGEPSYLTASSNSGTTIRLGCPRSAPSDCAIFFNCRTTLVQEFRIQFQDIFRFEKNRAVIISREQDIPKAAVRFCLARALTYKLRARPAWAKSEF